MSHFIKSIGPLTSYHWLDEDGVPKITNPMMPKIWNDNKGLHGMVISFWTKGIDQSVPSIANLNSPGTPLFLAKRLMFGRQASGYDQYGTFCIKDKNEIKELEIFGINPFNYKDTVEWYEVVQMTFIIHLGQNRPGYVSLFRNGIELVTQKINPSIGSFPVIESCNLKKDNSCINMDMVTDSPCNISGTKVVGNAHPSWEDLAVWSGSPSNIKDARKMAKAIYNKGKKWDYREDLHHSIIDPSRLVYYFSASPGTTNNLAVGSCHWYNQMKDEKVNQNTTELWSGTAQEHGALYIENLAEPEGKQWRLLLENYNQNVLQPAMNLYCGNGLGKIFTYFLFKFFDNIFIFNK